MLSSLHKITSSTTLWYTYCFQTPNLISLSLGECTNADNNSQFPSLGSCLSAQHCTALTLQAEESHNDHEMTWKQS
jgi:hypothetical protein